MRNYSRIEVFINNLPYVLMIVLGAAVLAVGLEMTRWAWAAAGGYLAYGVIGAFWIVLFVCPHCGHHGSRCCPCGYGLVSAGLREKAAGECFDEKFKKHILVIVPLWLIPLAAGGAIAVRRFSWLLLGLVAAFAVEALVILPLVSRRHGCADCPQKARCPWMRKRRASAPPPAPVE